VDWDVRAAAAEERYRGGRGREADQRQLTQLGNAAWASGLCRLMAGRREEGAEWLRRAARRYEESRGDAPPDSWGRPIAIMKALLLAGEDATGAAEAALAAGAASALSPIGRYAAALATLVLGDDAGARTAATALRGRDDFPQPVADALATLAAGDRAGYALAVESVLASFEERERHLEDVAVADTVLVLQRLAARRGLEAQLPASPLLPGS
jgi:hypothetical protein